MNKKKIVEQLASQLSAELEALIRAAKAAHEAATHDESKAEDQYDTRGLEASYLAGAQAQRAEEIQKLIQLFKFLPLRNFDPSDEIAASALIELKQENGARSLYFVAPQGGGLSTQLDGRTVQVLTPQSTLGEEILGRKAGDSVEIEMRGATREYEIVSVR